MIACNSRNTKQPGLGFHAVLSDNTRELRFELMVFTKVWSAYERLLPHPLLTSARFFA